MQRDGSVLAATEQNRQLVEAFRAGARARMADTLLYLNPARLKLAPDSARYYYLRADESR